MDAFIYKKDATSRCTRVEKLRVNIDLKSIGRARLFADITCTIDHYIIVIAFFRRRDRQAWYTMCTLRRAVAVYITRTGMYARKENSALPSLGRNKEDFQETSVYNARPSGHLKRCTREIIRIHSR